MLFRFGQPLDFSVLAHRLLQANQYLLRYGLTISWPIFVTDVSWAQLSGQEKKIGMATGLLIMAKGEISFLLMISPEIRQRSNQAFCFAWPRNRRAGLAQR
jgi:hypothetical protein